MRLLCAGDNHIGRCPTHLPDHLDRRPFSAAAVWNALVDQAIERQVDAVALTGDVVDRDNRFFEAYGPLRRGIRRLVEKGIETFAVAGNHDFDVLPRLPHSLGSEHFHLLGQGERWERFTVQRAGQPVVHIDGWSFARQHVHTSPLETYDLPPDENTPTIGLLHADVDQPASRYGPVRLDELQNKPVAIWLLGHVHRPTCHESAGAPIVLYPGSPQALDPGETGKHGPWLVEIESGHNIRVSHIPLARVRYDVLDLDLAGLDDLRELEQRICQAIENHLEVIADDAGPLEHLRCRLRLTGRTQLHGQLETYLAKLCRDIELARGQITATVDRVDCETDPDVDLNELARGSDVPAQLARLILALQADAGPGEHAPLVRAAQQKMAEVHRARSYLPIASADSAPDVDAARRLLIRQGSLLLDRLLAQKEEE